MSYQELDQPRRHTGAARPVPQPTGSVVIVVGAVLAVLAMVAVITAGSRTARSAADPSAPWLDPPLSQASQAPIPLLSEAAAPARSLSVHLSATTAAGHRPSPSRPAAGSPSRPAASSTSRPPAAPAAVPPGATAPGPPFGRPSWPTRSPAAVRPVPAPGARVSLVATGTTDVRLRHQNFRMTLTRIGAGSPYFARADATFVVRRGLADADCLSLESVNFPGRFMRHQNFTLVLQPRESSRLFAGDATFCPQKIGPGADFLLRSVNYPGRYLTAAGPRLLLGAVPPGSAQSFRATAGL